ncbi:DUF2147 domain-containing protein [Dokdonella sp.]|uniref:DUF2147 domain-containing protein n=1 Tax=Dokdonella sp. TaxID=2291710 RepID=UPI0031C66C7E|nr:DUF2147 domain-containing protein [Dokdonella sp.]
MLLPRCTALLALAFVFAAIPVAAADLSPVGTWTTIDDATGKAKSVVQISESNGELTGTVLEVLESDQGPNPLCTKCKGDLKDQPVTGMRIIWGMKQDGDTWQGGKILDPKTGKIYGCKLHVIDDGQKLEVRGFMGFSLLGRTQVWVRKE